MSGEQRIRAFLFYISVTIFFLGLPFILSLSLGYKFNRKTFKFTKTGIISLKTQPAGASVYFEKRLLEEKTPASINELLPGRYNIELKLEGYYPYSIDVEVEAKKVSRLEQIILFPLIPDVEQLNKDKISFFWVDETRGMVYYVNEDDNIIYKSDPNGEHFEEVAKFIPILPMPKKWALSSDREKLMYFNSHQIGIVNFSHRDKKLDTKSFILHFPNETINEVFWYSDDYHLILVCSNKIIVCEARPDTSSLNLVNLNKRNSAAYFDSRIDTLYFLDSQRASDGQYYDNLYRISLNKRLSPFQFQELIKIKQNERE